MTDQLLSPKEAAAYLTVHRATLYRHQCKRRRCDGTCSDLHFLKVAPGVTRIRRSELERYLRDNERRVA